jgi:hypothetical protein
MIPSRTQARVLPSSASFPPLKHSVTYFITDPGGGRRAAKLREQDEPQRGQDRDEGFGLEMGRKVLPIRESPLSGLLP